MNYMFLFQTKHRKVGIFNLFQLMRNFHLSIRLKTKQKKLKMQSPSKPAPTDISHLV